MFPGSMGPELQIQKHYTKCLPLMNLLRHSDVTATANVNVAFAVEENLTLGLMSCNLNRIFVVHMVSSVSLSVSLSAANGMDTSPSLN
jgi:hypothetical protein